MQIMRTRKKKNKLTIMLVGSILFLTACNLPSSQSNTDIPISSPTQTQTLPTETVPPQDTATPEPTEIPPEPTALPTEPEISDVVTFPNPDNYSWVPVARFLFEPIDMAHSNDGTGKLYIAEKRGLIWQLEGDFLWPDPYLDIQTLTNPEGYETGLLGIAFHPNYINNGYLYVYYTNLNGNTIIARFEAAFDADQIDPATRTIIYTTQQPYHNHNGGKIVFGPDGYLYIALGDGGSQGDPLGNGQNTNTPLGAILRIDVDNGAPYAIPPDNPFVNGGGLPEVWAYGLRNPWKFSFDQETGDLYIGDVGQNSFEEINFLPGGITGGSNFGWNYFEGTHTYAGSPPTDATFVMPVAEYGREGGNCTVVGGYVYRGDEMPEWNGVYFYGDYCSGTIWGLTQNTTGEWQSQILYQGLTWLSSFGQDQDGNLYLLSFDGSVYRLTGN